jgi:hypothetical protein
MPEAAPTCRRPLVWYFSSSIRMIEVAGMGGTEAASDLLVQTVGDFVPIPLTIERRLGI